MNARVTTEQKSQELSKQLAAALQKGKDQKAAEFNEFLSQFDEMKEIPGMEEIASLIALPDEQFALIAPAVLEEMEKSMNDPNDKMLLIQSLNAKNVTIEEFREQFKIIEEEIDKTLEGQLSQQKIDFLKTILAASYNMVEDTQGVASRFINVPIELCREGAKLPAYAHEGDAGADIYSPADYDIMPGETVIIPTGIKMNIPKGYQVEIRSRSGLAAKTPLRVANSPATIDSNYSGEIGVIMTNIASQYKDLQLDWTTPTADHNEPTCYVKSFMTNPPIHIEKGERIAQMVLMPAPVMTFRQVESITQDENRGEGGYGSSGKF